MEENENEDAPAGTRSLLIGTAQLIPHGTSHLSSGRPRMSMGTERAKQQEGTENAGQHDETRLEPTTPRTVVAWRPTASSDCTQTRATQGDRPSWQQAWRWKSSALSVHTCVN